MSDFNLLTDNFRYETNNDGTWYFYNYSFQKDRNKIKRLEFTIDLISLDVADNNGHTLDFFFNKTTGNFGTSTERAYAIRLSYDSDYNATNSNFGDLFFHDFKAGAVTTIVPASNLTTGKTIKVVVYFNVDNTAIEVYDNSTNTLINSVTLGYFDFSYLGYSASSDGTASINIINDTTFELYSERGSNNGKANFSTFQFDRSKITDNVEVLYHFSGNANDSSGNGHNGIVDGAILASDKNGNSNSAYYFDGTNDIIDMNYNTNYQDVTISFWMKADSFSANAGLVNKYSSGSYDGVNVFIDGNNKLCGWYFGDSSNYVRLDNTGNEPVLNTNQWYFVTMVIKNGQYGYMYLDGKKLNSANWTGAIKNSTTSNNWIIGKYPQSTSVYFNGTIDEVRIYNRVLTDDEILELYLGYDTDLSEIETKTYKTLAYYKLDGDATDATGNGYNGAEYNGVAYSSGKINKGADFYNKDLSRIQIGSSTDFDFQNTSEYTISCWIYPMITGDYCAIITKSEGASNIIQYELRIESTNLIGIVHHTGTSYALYGPTIQANKWYFITVTNDGTQEKLYINGELYGAQTGTWSHIDVPVLISSRYINNNTDIQSGTNFNGIIDEVGFWNRALTDLEILQLYNEKIGVQYPFEIQKKLGNFFKGAKFWLGRNF